MDTSKIKTSSCAAMSLVSLFSGAYPVLQSAFPLPYLFPRRNFSTTRKEHSTSSEEIGKVEESHTSTRFLRRARMPYPFVDASREISPDRSHADIIKLYERGQCWCTELPGTLLRKGAEMQSEVQACPVPDSGRTSFNSTLAPRPPHEGTTRVCVMRRLRPVEGERGRVRDGRTGPGAGAG